MLPDCSEFQSQNVQMYGYVFHDASGQSHGRTLKTLWFLLSEICTVTHLLERQFEGEKVPNWECLFVHRKQGLSLSVSVGMTPKRVEKKQNLSLMLNKRTKLVDLGEPTSILDHRNVRCTQRECKPNESVIEEYRKMFVSRTSAGATEKLLGCEKLHAKTVAWSYEKVRRTILRFGE